jgi:hypothetical protein
LPSVKAIRYATIQKLLNFVRAGGVVIAIGELPAESDRVGRNDAELQIIIKELFGISLTDANEQKVFFNNSNENGGSGIFLSNIKGIVDWITKTIQRDFIPLNDQGIGYVNHRKIGSRNVYIVRNVPKYSECYFKAVGKVELWNPWDGTTKPLYTCKPSAGGTIVKIPMEVYEDNLIVFTVDTPGIYVEATNLEYIDLLTFSKNTSLTGYAALEGEKYADVCFDYKSVRMRGQAKPIQKIVVDGTWNFQLKPTLDNQWGDFRIPATKEFIGAEARFFKFKEETEPDAALYSPDYDDSSWQKITYSKQTAFWMFTPSSGYHEEQFVQNIHRLSSINNDSVIDDGTNKISAKAYDYSIRWGITDSSVEEQNWHHGLNGIVPNEFLKIAPKSEIFFWSTVYAQNKAFGEILTGAVKPHKIWINGTLLTAGQKLYLSEGYNTILLKYSNTKAVPKRAYFVIQDPCGTSTFKKYPLAMDWFVKPNIYKMDAFPQSIPQIGIYRFSCPIGIRTMEIAVFGSIEVWINGEPAKIQNVGKTVYGADEYRVTVQNNQNKVVHVAIRVHCKKGYTQGAVFPEPIQLQCSEGLIDAGDWSKLGVLENYSGGAIYSKCIEIPEFEKDSLVFLNLVKIATTAEVIVNGKPVGIRVCPPWKVNISNFVKQGKNAIEIIVYNTLSNHYSTIPSRYSNFPKDAVSGLIGPVMIEIIPPVRLI